MTKTIYTKKGHEILVDADKYDYLNQFNWHVTGNYASRGGKHPKVNNGNWATIYMHRELMGFPKGLAIDHCNRKHLDNRIENLRICTPSQNQANNPKQSNNTSGFRGVQFCKERKKFRVKLNKNRKTHYGGQYSCLIEAAKAYNRLAIEHFGEFACLNIIP